MNRNQFHLLKSPKEQNVLAEWLSDEIKTERVSCPIYKEDHRRGGKRLTDLSVLLPGRSVDDFVWTWQSECLIQDHVLGVLEKKCFSGFVVRPAKARFEEKNAEEPPRLWELVVTG